MGKGRKGEEGMEGKGERKGDGTGPPVKKMVTGLYSMIFHQCSIVTVAYNVPFPR